MNCPRCNKDYHFICDKIDTALIIVWGKCQKCLDKMYKERKD